MNNSKTYKTSLIFLICILTNAYTQNIKEIHYSIYSAEKWINEINNKPLQEKINAINQIIEFEQDSINKEVNKFAIIINGLPVSENERIELLNKTKNNKIDSILFLKSPCLLNMYPQICVPGIIYIFPTE